jgi:hypothetical protein
LLGAALALTVVAVAVVAFVYLSQPRGQALTAAEVPTLTQALSTVPERDVAGPDPGGPPRPAGSVRGYTQVRGTTTLVVYSRHGTMAEVVADLRKSLPAAGWTREGSEGTVPGTAQSWVALFSRGRQIANVAVTTDKDVTAATYIIQGTAG